MSDRRRSILKKPAESGVETPTKQVKIVVEEENTLRRSARKSVKNIRYTNELFEDVTSQESDDNSKNRRTPNRKSLVKNETSVNEESNTPRRRSSRRSIQNSRYSATHEQPKRTPRKKSTNASSEDESEENEQENDDNCNTEAAKTSELLFEEKDVEGKKMFGFQTPKRRSAMAQKVSEVVNSPAFHTPKKTENENTLTKTPHAIRSKMKKQIAVLVKENNNSGSDFSDSGSDFKPSDDSSSEDEVSPKESESDSDSSDGDKKNKILLKPSRTIQNRSIRNKKDVTYTMKTDAYFASQTSKIVTSNHTLQRLKNPKLSEHQLQELLKIENLNLSNEHGKSIQNLFDSNCNDFDQWMVILNEGFSILLYGLGSKRNILGQFQKELLEAKYPVLVVNGYFPSLTIKDILDSIYVDLLEHKEGSNNIFETVDLIKDDFEHMPNSHLYLIVHNIEGEMLRNNKSQNVLAALAEIPNLHLIASIDHINTPLIWDHAKLGKFNFIWWDTTSFLPYTDETSFESSLLVQKSGALVLSSISSVYQSLTKNSKGIFMLIVKYQLSKKDEKHYQGMPFKTLYSMCRENFLVSSDLALRAQLTEFLDHKLVRSKRTSDGTEQLTIPIHNSILQQFSEEV